MRLEESLERIESVDKNRKNCEKAISDALGRVKSSEEKDIGRSLQDIMNLRFASLAQNQFYHYVDILNAWAKTDVPDPRNYGEGAVDWLKSEIKANRGDLPAIVGVSVGAASYLMEGSNGLTPFPILMGYIFKEITQKHLEKKSYSLLDVAGARDYATELAFHPAVGRFLEKSVKSGIIERDSRSYMQALKFMSGEDRVLNDGECEAFIENYSEIDRLRKDFGDIVQSIGESKSYLLSDKDGVFSLVVKSLEESLEPAPVVYTISIGSPSPEL